MSILCTIFCLIDGHQKTILKIIKVGKKHWLIVLSKDGSQKSAFIHLKLARVLFLLLQEIKKVGIVHGCFSFQTRCVAHVCVWKKNKYRTCGFFVRRDESTLLWVERSKMLSTSFSFFNSCFIQKRGLPKNAWWWWCNCTFSIADYDGSFAQNTFWGEDKWWRGARRLQPIWVVIHDNWFYPMRRRLTAIPHPVLSNRLAQLVGSIRSL